MQSLRHAFVRRTSPHLATALCAGLLAAAAWAADPAATDQAAVRHVLMATFDKPEARLQVEPVIVAGQHALAGWSQGGRGGRALLYRKGTQWQIALCGGDGLKDAKVLREAGVAATEAESLAKRLASAEAGLPAAQRARFSTFDGLVRMDADGQHPPVHKH